MASRNFFTALKRRTVIRFAWLIVQFVSTVLPMFRAPGWLPRSTTN